MDIRNLDSTKQTPLDLALNIGEIGISAVTVLPGIYAVSKALQAMGIFGTGVMGVLSTLVAGIAALGVAFTSAYAATTSVIKGFDLLSQVLSGSITLEEAVNRHIDDMTLGITHLGDEAKKTSDELQKLFLTGSDQDIEDQKQKEKLIAEGFDEKYGKGYSENLIRADKQERERQDNKRENEERYRQELYKTSDAEKTGHADKMKNLNEELKIYGDIARVTQAKADKNEVPPGTNLTSMQRIVIEANKMKVALLEVQKATIPEPTEGGGGKKKDFKTEGEAFNAILSNSQTVQGNISRLLSILNVGTETFVYKMVGGFNDVLSVIGLIRQSIEAINTIKSAISFLSLVGLAGGGELPGFGGGDKVPAMLEPGEGVLNKYAMLRAKSMFGENFLSLLNGYGAMTSRMNHLSMGGMVSNISGRNIILQLSGDISDYFALKVAMKGNPQYNLRVQKAS